MKLVQAEGRYNQQGLVRAVTAFEFDPKISSSNFGYDKNSIGQIDKIMYT